MNKTGLKTLLAFSLLLSGFVSAQLANEYYFQYQMNEMPEALKAYSSAMALSVALMTLSCITFIWAAVSAYFRE